MCKKMINDRDISKKIETIAVCADKTIEKRQQEIVCEHLIDIIVNEQLLARLVCTPSNLEELVVGRLLTERVINRIEDIDKLYICESARKAKVFLNPSVKLKLNEKLMIEPTCCTQNRIFLKNESEMTANQIIAPEWKKEWIFELAESFSKGAFLHGKTNGTHSCYLSVKGKTIYAAEDIGRHNALDKVIGYAAMHNISFSDCIVFTSGRVPTDMLYKVISVGIPIIVSKAVPTKEAVELAEQSKVTLICRAWQDSFEIYAGQLTDR